eukprot:520606-Hanusia_phi.AAC.1
MPTPCTASACAPSLTRRVQDDVRVRLYQRPGRRPLQRPRAGHAGPEDSMPGPPHGGALPASGSTATPWSRCSRRSPATRRRTTRTWRASHWPLYALVYEKRVSVSVKNSALAAGASRAARVQECECLICGVRAQGGMTQGTIARLPDPPYIGSHASNALWTLLYWNAEDRHPDPYSNTYGYKRARTGAPDWGINRPKRKA